MDEFGKKMSKKIPAISKRTLEILQGYHWPGNIRELRNILEHAFIMNNGEPLRVQLPKNSPGVASNILTLEEAEHQHIIEVLEMTHWRVKGQHGAAELLGLHPATLHSKMRKLGIPFRFLREKDDISSNR
jgi:transcriptional regulator of acetoin/glycerol metabolism